MAAPIGILFTYIGFLIGVSISNSKLKKSLPTMVVLLLLSVPVFMSFEYKYKLSDDLRSVTTSIEINASTETVWRNVISFPQLKDPTEFIFKTSG